MSDQATCGHPAVDRETVPFDGATAARWACRECKMRFSPAVETMLELPDDSDYDEFGAPFDNLKDVRQSRALRALLKGGNVKAACRAAGITYSAWYRWKNEDSEFRRMYERALQALAEELEPDALARAKESDALTMFFLKAWNPARYRDRQVIEVVSPDVQSRLAQQADAIMQVCKEKGGQDGPILASHLAHRLREIWSSDEDRKRIGP